jgi:hypothetical protein
MPFSDDSFSLTFIFLDYKPPVAWTRLQVRAMPLESLSPDTDANRAAHLIKEKSA